MSPPNSVRRSHSALRIPIAIHAAPVGHAIQAPTSVIPTRLFAMLFRGGWKKIFAGAPNAFRVAPQIPLDAITPSTSPPPNRSVFFVKNPGPQLSRLAATEPANRILEKIARIARWIV
ncbi:MAG: hypothetical protein F9K48_00710 [Candidatus Brocadia sp.]|nr:MAG: hypothetical protein F9K48_00710 [Candidatus Brocadia sp.]